MKPLIIIVEQNDETLQIVESSLKNDGYGVLIFKDGEALLRKIDNIENLVLLVLGVMLPCKDGFEIAEEISQKPEFTNLPIVILTPKGYECNNVGEFITIEFDYLKQTFSSREFISIVNSKVKSYIKLIGGSLRTDIIAKACKINTSDKEILTCSDIRLNDLKHRVYKGEREIELTPREYELLKFMMKHCGVAYSRETLLANAWGYEYMGRIRTVDVHIRQLRRKIENDDKNPRLIQSVQGIGYRLAEK